MQIYSSIYEFSLQFLLLARIVSHILIGIVFGYLYMNVGNSAHSVLGNYVYLYGSTLLLVYTGKMAVVLTCKSTSDLNLLENKMKKCTIRTKLVWYRAL